MTDLEIILRACVKANPEIETGRSGRMTADTSVILNEIIHYRTIRLADVLLAIEEKLNIDHGMMSELPVAMNDAVCFWNLRADDLSQQSTETLKFLAKLLSE